MQLHLGQAFAAGEFVVVDDVIPFLIAGPVGVRLVRRLLRQHREGDSNQEYRGQGAHKHLFPSQSGKSNSLHQPVGLMSPSTTFQLRGLTKSVQAAQLNMPLGVS